MHIKQRHLEVFDAVIASGSISRAAAQLNLSQPAVSIALANLEESIGFKLFQRDRGFFAPTRPHLRKRYQRLRSSFSIICIA